MPEFGEARARHRVTHAATGPRARATTGGRASNIAFETNEGSDLKRAGGTLVTRRRVAASREVTRMAT